MDFRPLFLWYSFPRPSNLVLTFFLVYYGLRWGSSQGIRGQDIFQEQIIWLVPCMRGNIDREWDGWYDVLTRRHRVFLGVSKHDPELCNQITEVYTVKYQEYRIKDPAVQLGILLSLLSYFMEHNLHALP